jgi:hypothetical protein
MANEDKIFLVKTDADDYTDEVIVKTRKHIELTKELEEKITNEVMKTMYEKHKWAWQPAGFCNNTQPIFMESGVLVAIKEVFQKLKEELK